MRAGNGGESGESGEEKEEAMEIQKELRRLTAAMMKKESFYFSLEEERRPPYIGCWLLKEMMPTATTKLQQLASLGEEFDGDDFDDETD